jgi:hypothetical protein
LVQRPSSDWSKPEHRICTRKSTLRVASTYNDCRVPCASDSTYTQWLFAGVGLVEVVDMRPWVAADTVVRTSAAVLAAHDTGRDGAVEAFAWRAEPAERLVKQVEAVVVEHSRQQHRQQVRDR